MKEAIKQQLAAPIQAFHLPRYREIPDMGLYLEQVTQYISDRLAPLQENAITSSMVSNYVKKGLVANPIKKRYSREQIAYLMFIALAKNVLSLDNLILFIGLQQRTYPVEVAYEYICDELENALHYVFGLKEKMEFVGVDYTDEKFLLRDTVVAIAHKICLDKCFACMAEEENA